MNEGNKSGAENFRDGQETLERVFCGLNFIYYVKLKIIITLVKKYQLSADESLTGGFSVLYCPRSKDGLGGKHLFKHSPVLTDALAGKVRAG